MDRIITGDRVLCDNSPELGRILPNKHDEYCVVFETVLQTCLYLSARLSACIYVVYLKISNIGTVDY